MEIAAAIGLTPEALYRALAALEAKGAGRSAADQRGSQEQSYAMLNGDLGRPTRVDCCELIKPMARSEFDALLE